MLKLIKYILIVTILIPQFSLRASDQIAIQNILKTIHPSMGFQGNILVKKGAKVVYETSQGLANREWNVSHTEDSKFMIASLTKQFTAYAILNLAEEDKLNLNDSIAKYITLPIKTINEAKDWEKITIQQLLSHQGGLIRDIKRTDYMSTSDFNLIGTIIFHTLQKTKIIVKEPGSFAYSNLGYLLLAAVIEKVSSKKYFNYLNREIFTPLEMWDTGEFHRIKSIPNMAEGYYFNDLRRINKRCCHDASLFTGSHNLYSTIDDLEKWMSEIYRDKSVLNQQVIKKLKETVTEAYKGNQYGYGLFHDKKNNVSRVWHNGHEWGYVSLMSYIPKLDLTVIYLSNLHGYEVFGATARNEKFHNNVVDYFLEGYEKNTVKH